MVWRGFCLSGTDGQRRRAHGISGQILGKSPLFWQILGMKNAGQEGPNPESLTLLKRPRTKAVDTPLPVGGRRAAAMLNARGPPCD